MEDLLWRSCIHEAGHCLMAYLQPDTFLRSSTFDLTDFGPKNVDNKHVLNQVVKVYLGGIAAEHLFFKTPIGGDEDIEKIEKLTKKNLHDDLDDVIDTLSHYKKYLKRIAYVLYSKKQVTDETIQNMFGDNGCTIS